MKSLHWAVLLTLLGVMPRATSAQITCSCTASPCVLKNTSTSTEYRLAWDTNTGHVWLDWGQQQQPGGPVVDFLPATLWKVELRIPHAATGKEVNPGTVNPCSPPGCTPPLALTLGNPMCLPAGSPNTILFTWTGNVQPENVDLQVICSWRLRPENDYLETGIRVEILNPSTPYRIWNVRYPRIEIPNLDPAAFSPDADQIKSGVIGGVDRLATGRYGGFLHGNPIKWKDKGGKPLRLSGDPAAPFIHGSSGEPALFALPFVYYYNSATGTGVYVSHNDDVGFVKGINLSPNDPGGMSPGSLTYELVQPPSAVEGSPVPVPVSIFDMTKYEPYVDYNGFLVHVGVMKGDWIDAAKKYKAYRLTNTDNKFTWLHQPNVRPTGNPSNTAISDEFRANPIQVRIDPIEIACPPPCTHAPGYCVGLLNVGTSHAPSVPPCSTARDTIASTFDWIDSRFGEPAIPYLMFARFPVSGRQLSYDPIAGASWQPSQDTSVPMQETQALMLMAESRGHRVLLDSMTEKFLEDEEGANECKNNRCCLAGDGTEQDYCRDMDPDWRDLKWDCRIIGDAVTLLPGNRSCPAGISGSLGEPSNVPATGCAPAYPAPVAIPGGLSIGQAFAELVASAISGLQVTGGTRWNTPSIGLRICFSEFHRNPGAGIFGHKPGFGTWSLDAWRLIISSIRSQAALPADFFWTIEGGNLMMSEDIRVQNPYSLDFDRDQENDSNVSQASTWGDYFDAPIWTIPATQMVADEIKYCTQYGLSTLSLPYTNATQLVAGSDFFENYPAVSAALSCYAQAKRALMYQASIVIDAHNMVDACLFEGAADSPEKQAAQGMLSFYEGLIKFLKASDGGHRNMDYFCGSMERAASVVVTTQPETFFIPGSAIDFTADLVPPIGCDDAGSVFPDLAAALQHPSILAAYTSDSDDTDCPIMPNVRYDRYRPVHDVLFSHGFYTQFLWHSTPAWHETWLPNGVYRHWNDATDNKGTLVILVANPWGVKYQNAAGTIIRPMNPFTFKYLDPANSPTSNAYGYALAFDPKRYGINGNYTVTRRTWDATGNLVGGTPPPQIIFGGSTYSHNASLGESRFRAYYIDEL